MKKLILTSLLSFLFCNNIEAQEITTEKSMSSFVEWNLGAALLGESYFPFPGTSVLWGKTFINENNLIFEYEAGLAFPTLFTGKLGIGKKFNNTNVIIGVRPFPISIYLQSSFISGKKGYWITSIEFNPIYENKDALYSGIINFGYRWDILKLRFKKKI